MNFIPLYKTIYSSLSEEERSLLRYSHHRSQERTQYRRAIYHELYEIFLNKDPAIKTQTIINLTLIEQSIALSLIYKKESQRKA